MEKYFTVDEDKVEVVFHDKPQRSSGSWYSGNSRFVELPPGSIEKITGEKRSWDDEPLKIKWN